MKSSSTKPVIPSMPTEGVLSVIQEERKQQRRMKHIPARVEMPMLFPRGEAVWKVGGARKRIPKGGIMTMKGAVWNVKKALGDDFITMSEARRKADEAHKRTLEDEIVAMAMAIVETNEGNHQRNEELLIQLYQKYFYTLDHGHSSMFNEMR